MLHWHKRTRSRANPVRRYTSSPSGRRRTEFAILERKSMTMRRLLLATQKPAVRRAARSGRQVAPVDCFRVSLRGEHFVKND